MQTITAGLTNFDFGLIAIGDDDDDDDVSKKRTTFVLTNYVDPSRIGGF